ncbi:MAG: glycosyltransferase family 4 protein [Muribaculaceae bacterium]|nr:glycosyltransferase family 4 protein [Muribaculaceae bacterium]
MMKIIRTSTVPGSLNNFCRGLLGDLQREEGYEVVAVSSPGDALDEVAEREGVKTYAVPMRRNISPLNDLKSLYHLIKVFKKERPDMVHSITPKAGLLSMMAAWVCRVPVRIHTFTGLVFPTSTGLKKRILMLTDRITCACATHIIPEGEGVKADLSRYKITNKPLKVLGYGNIRGIDLKRFDPEIEEIKSPADALRKNDIFTFIFIGRLVGDKGVNELVAAFKKLNIEYPKSRLILVGRKEQNLDPLTSETLAEIETNNSIEAVGEKNDVRPWLLASDAFVLSSYREGFPNVVIEAGAMGLPSIVTDINGSREIIVHGVNGDIVPSKDSEALYSAMKSFIESPGKLEKYRSEARPLIEKRFEIGFVQGCLKDFYNKVQKK